MPQLVQRQPRLKRRRTALRRGGRTAARGWYTGTDRRRLAFARAAGRRSARNSGPLGRSAISRGSSRAEPDWRCSHSVSLPLERTRARLFSRSTSSTFSERTSCARGAVHTTDATALSHALRRRLGARAGRAERKGIALVRSTGSRRRSSPSAIGASIQPRRIQKPENDRSVATWRFHVAGAVWPHASRAARSSSRAPSRSTGRSTPRACCRRASVWGVRALAGVGEVGMGEEFVDRVGEARNRVTGRAQPLNGPPQPGHRRECVGSTAGGEHASPDGCWPGQS